MNVITTALIAGGAYLVLRGRGTKTPVTEVAPAVPDAALPTSDDVTAAVNNAGAGAGGSRGGSGGGHYRIDEPSATTSESKPADASADASRAPAAIAVRPPKAPDAPTRATPVSSVPKPAAPKVSMKVARNAKPPSTASGQKAMLKGLQEVSMYGEQFGRSINRMQWRPPELATVRRPDRYGVVAPGGGAQTAKPQTVAGVLARAGLNGLGTGVGAPSGVEINAVRLGEWDWGGIVKDVIGVVSNITGGSTPPPAQGYLPQPQPQPSGGIDPALIALLKPQPTDYTPWMIGGAALIGVVALMTFMKR